MYVYINMCMYIHICMCVCIYVCICVFLCVLNKQFSSTSLQNRLFFLLKKHFEHWLKTCGNCFVYNGSFLRANYVDMGLKRCRAKVLYRFAGSLP